MRWFPRAIVLSALAVLVLGCGRSVPVRPEPATDVRLDLALSVAEGSRQSPLSIHTLVRNMGRKTVHHLVGCGCDGISIEIRDAQGVSVVIQDPCAPVCAGACGPTPFTSGATLEREHVFAGDLYRYGLQGCVLEDAPSGTYTVIARYVTVPWEDGDQLQLERRATFRWTGAS